MNKVYALAIAAAMGLSSAAFAADTTPAQGAPDAKPAAAQQHHKKAHHHKTKAAQKKAAPQKAAAQKGQAAKKPAHKASAKKHQHPAKATAKKPAA